MSCAVSPSSRLTYGVQRVCRVWRVPRSSFYDWKRRSKDSQSSARRGPKPVTSDEEIASEIRKILGMVEDSFGFRGEGYRKVHARLHFAGHAITKRRVNRIMRESGLLAPCRRGTPRGPRAHDGTITTDTPDAMWGTDATQVWTSEEGLVWVFAATDHCTAELVGTHASTIGTRFEALVPVQEAVRERFGSLDQGVASGLSLRHDHGTQYMSKHFQREIRFWGIESSPSFVRAPEGNGIAERMMRTLKEQVLHVRNFKDAEEVRVALAEFRQVYNAELLIGRHGYRSPPSVRREQAA